jgi:hypothetical protein
MDELQKLSASLETTLNYMSDEIKKLLLQGIKKSHVSP